jgi:hypothetical protein
MRIKRHGHECGQVRTPEQDEGGDEGDAEGHTPAPGVVLCAVVDQLGDQDADGDHQLEQDVECTPQPGGRHLAVIQGRALQHTGGTRCEQGGSALTLLCVQHD